MFLPQICTKTLPHLPCLLFTPASYSDETSRRVLLSLLRDSCGSFLLSLLLVNTTPLVVLPGFATFLHRTRTGALPRSFLFFPTHHPLPPFLFIHLRPPPSSSPSLLSSRRLHNLSSTSLFPIIHQFDPLFQASQA